MQILQGMARLLLEAQHFCQQFFPSTVNSCMSRQASKAALHQSAEQEEEKRLNLGEQALSACRRFFLIAWSSHCHCFRFFAACFACGGCARGPCGAMRAAGQGPIPQSKTHILRKEFDVAKSGLDSRCPARTGGGRLLCDVLRRAKASLGEEGDEAQRTRTRATRSQRFSKRTSRLLCRRPYRLQDRTALKRTIGLHRGISFRRQEQTARP